MSQGDLCEASAVSLRERIATRECACEEVVSAFCERIDALNPVLNALCTFAPEQALEQARSADARLAAGKPPRALEGLPVAVKDLAETRGMRTTFGSPLFAEHVPDFDQLFVSRLRAAGAIIVGKTNTPEFGAGSHTFNRVFGATRNPWDLSRTVGGSSGGAAAALAARMVPLADGSDLGGSLRNPAGFCNVLGLRPSPGRVPSGPASQAWDPLAVLGPMARSVDDLALLLSVMAGPDAGDPLSRPESGAVFAPPIDARALPVRIAFSPDLGFLPVAEQIRDGFAAALTVLSGLGCAMSPAAPDLHDAPDAFLTLRSLGYVGRFGETYRRTPDAFKDTIAWNIEQGLALTPARIAQAQAVHGAIHGRMVRFFEDHDFMVLPTTQVVPFAVELDWVHEIDGVRMAHYLEWMSICSAITMTGCPAISVPAGFTQEGLPIGLQIVAPPGADLALLGMARLFEQATAFAARVPQGAGHAVTSA